MLADDEFFEDGLVLLKHDLCWEFEDMITVKRNVFPKAHRSYLSERARKIIKGNTINSTSTYKLIFKPLYDKVTFIQRILFKFRLAMARLYLVRIL